jgi:hypothetical protein
LIVEPHTNFRVRIGLPADEAVLIPLYEAYRSANDGFVSVNKKSQVQGLAVDIIASEGARLPDFACVVAMKLLNFPRSRAAGGKGL